MAGEKDIAAAAGGGDGTEDFEGAIDGFDDDVAVRSRECEHGGSVGDGKGVGFFEEESAGVGDGGGEFGDGGVNLFVTGPGTDASAGGEDDLGGVAVDVGSFGGKVVGNGHRRWQFG